MGELEDGLFIGEHKYCIAGEFPQRKNGNARRSCVSTDALAVYEHETKGGGSTYYTASCFSCRQGFTTDEVHTSSLAAELGVVEGSAFVKDRVNFEHKASKKSPITREQRIDLWNKTQDTAGGYRGFSDEMLKFYGHRTAVGKEGGVVAQYYPETLEGKLTGYKSKHFPKGFGYDNYGKTGISNDLSGQHKFPDGGKYVLLVGGEDDKIAAAMMLRENQLMKKQGEYNHFSVVSPTTGEPSAAKQCRANYDWFDKHDCIYIGMDNDDVGEEAALEIASVLPKEKVRIVKWSGKDPNKMLQEGRQKQFISDFWRAEEYMKSGIVGSSKIELSIFEELELEKVRLPPFMSQLEEHMAGGIPLGYIINLVAETGCGKTTIANECVYHWIFNCPYKVGIISMELDTGQYGLSLLSRHLGSKLQLFKDPQDAKDFMNQPENVVKRHNLWKDAEGRERFYLLDDQDGSLESLKKKIQRMILQFECRFIIIDPLQDILDGYSNEEQAVFMKWMKQTVKAYKVSFFNVNHVRKEGGGGFTRFLKEDDIQGSSAIAKSAGCNIIFTRDKLAEDDISKNVTKVFLPKCRWTGSTGDGGMWYYSLEEHTLYDMETYFAKNPDKVPSDVSYEELIENQKALFSRDKDKGGKSNKMVKGVIAPPIEIGGFNL